MNVEGVGLDNSVKFCSVEVFSLNKMAFIGTRRMAFEFHDGEVFCHSTELPNEEDEPQDIFFIKGLQLHPEDRTVYEMTFESDKLKPSRFDESKLETFIYNM